MKKNRKGKAVNEAIQRIKNMMYYRELSPGQRLIYGDLAKKLNMSPTPIVHALNRLEYSNLVEYRPNKGYFVGEVNEDQVMDIFGAKEALEIFIIPSVINNLTKNKLNDIRKTFREYEKLEDRRLLLLVDANFHLAISRIGGNQAICKMLDNILEQICLKYPLEYIFDDRKNEVVREHRSILRALETGDMELAVSAIKEHNKNSMEVTKQSLFKEQIFYSEF